MSSNKKVTGGSPSFSTERTSKNFAISQRLPTEYNIWHAVDYAISFSRDAYRTYKRDKTFALDEKPANVTIHLIRKIAIVSRMTT